jgi:hypothetical protein
MDLVDLVDLVDVAESRKKLARERAIERERGFFPCTWLLA